jgi:hypothetical protein
MLASTRAGRRAHQSRGTWIGRCETGDELAGAALPAVSDPLLDRRVPALRDRFAGEMHHDVASRQRSDRGGPGLPVPGDGVDVQALACASGVAR